ncbi:MAG: gluconate 2-dehydrogenase subunit 3 family protein [Chitinophagaceae bacterium]|uniref:gluconate 2-dehydrogenase subunit 3 family protein n=1 Tax=unclassified Paraflavitalea TaxID=2798305 RepID=UPI003D338973|nr:gluconate 2-dehydrogenase subunit 3 family protein [Chitinophagaceae bacterium]
MNRREALSRVAVLVGGTVVGAEFFLSGCKTGADKAAGLPLSKETIALLDEIAETIIPATSTPGAKEAKVGEFMNTMVMDCYEEKDQKVFLEGIGKVNEACEKMHKTDFMSATPQQRKDLLIALDKEAKEYQKSKKPEDPTHYFSLMKQLTLLGFFTSEVGATKALRYVAVPGKYEGCVPYKKGDRAWAT